MIYSFLDDQLIKPKITPHIIQLLQYAKMRHQDLQLIPLFLQQSVRSHRFIKWIKSHVSEIVQLTGIQKKMIWSWIYDNIFWNTEIWSDQVLIMKLERGECTLHQWISQCHPKKLSSTLPELLQYIFQIGFKSPLSKRLN